MATADSPKGHPDILRIVAPNPGPMTLEGTNTYVVGSDPAYVIDPGPRTPPICWRCDAAAEERGGIAGVLLTHSHADHSAGVADARRAAAVRRGGAPPTRARARPAPSAEAAGPAPVAEHAAGRPLRGPRRRPATRPTTSASCTARSGFCGDLVLGRGSTFVPPDGGSLAAYLDSLERLAAADLELLCPGHGPYIDRPRGQDRRVPRPPPDARASGSSRPLDGGERSRERLLASAWDDVPPELRPAAAVVMQAHLEKLEAEGRLPDDVAL